MLEQVAQEIGADTNWIHTLRETRHYFAHDKSPWIGVRIATDGTPEVLVLKSDLPAVADADGFLTIAQIQAIHQGLASGVEACADWLVDRIERQTGASE